MKIEADQLKAHIASILSAHPELAEDEVLRLDTLEGAVDLKETLSKLIRLIGETKSDMAGISSYAKTLMERHARFERRTEALRSLAFSIMQTADLKNIPLAEATLTIQKGQPKVIITDEAALTDKFVRIKREPDKAAIKETLKLGGTVNGASLSNAEPFLVIRTS